MVQVWHKVGNDTWEECTSKFTIRQVATTSAYDSSVWLYKLQLTPTFNTGEIRLSVTLI